MNIQALSSADRAEKFALEVELAAAWLSAQILASPLDRASLASHRVITDWAGLEVSEEAYLEVTKGAEQPLRFPFFLPGVWPLKQLGLPLKQPGNLRLYERPHHLKSATAPTCLHEKFWHRPPLNKIYGDDPREGFHIWLAPWQVYHPDSTLRAV